MTGAAAPEESPPLRYSGSNHRERGLMFETSIAGQPAEAVMARRAQQAVGAVAAQRRRSRGRQARRDAASPSSCRRTPASTSSPTASSRASTSSTASSSSSTASISQKRVEMGIRKDRYKAMVPTVTGPLTLTGRVHARRSAGRPRPHPAQAQVHPAGPDDHHRHHRRRAITATG